MSQDHPKFYVSVNEKIHGPFTFAQLQKLMLSNQITRKTQVLQEGVSNWIDAQHIPGLFPQFRAQEPPVVPTITPNPVRMPEVPVATAFPVHPDSELNLELPQTQTRRAVLLEEEENDERVYSSKEELNSKWLYGVFSTLFPGVGHLFLKQYMKGLLFLILYFGFAVFRGLIEGIIAEEGDETFALSVYTILGIPHFMFFTYIFLDCMATYDKIDSKLRSPKAPQKQVKYRYKKRSGHVELKLRENVFIIIWVLYLLYIFLKLMVMNNM